MANDIFNPTPDTVGVPDFRGYTKLVTAPEGNKALGTALSGLGQGLKEGGEIVKDYVKLDDYEHKESAKNATYAAMDPLQNAQIESLEGQVQELGGSSGKVLPPGDYAQADAPPPIAGLSQRMENLRTARETKGMNDMAYSAAIWSEAKSLRSQYPGYRDYIDSQIRKATGQDPANFRINSLKEGISALQTALGDPWKKAEGLNEWGIKEGLANAEKYAPQIRARVPGAIEAQEKDFQAQKAHQYQMAVRKQEYEDKIATRADAAFEIGKTVDEDMRGLTANDIAADRAMPDSNIPGSKGWLDKVSKASPEVQAAEGQRYATVLDQRINQQRAAMEAKGWEPIVRPDGSKTTRIQEAGGKAAYMAKVEENLAPQKVIRDNYNNKEFGPGTLNQRIAQASRDAVTREIVTDPVIGKSFLVNEYLNTHAPDYQKRLFEIDAKNNGNLVERLHAIASGRMLATAAPGPAGSNKDTLQRVNDSHNISPGDKGDLTQALLKDALSITDPTMPKDVKINKANAFFSAANAGQLDFLKDDYTTYDGKPVRGRQSVYSDFADPKMAKEMHNIGGETWANYKGYMEKEFSEVLFKSDIARMRNLGALDKRVKVSWDDKENQFKVDVDNSALGRPVTNLHMYRTRQLDELGVSMHAKMIAATVQHLNAGIHSLDNIYKEDGKQTNLQPEIVSVLKKAMPNDQPEESAAQRFLESFVTMAKKNNEANIKLIEEAERNKRKRLGM